MIVSGISGMTMRVCLLAGLVLFAATGVPAQQNTIAQSVDAAVRAAGVPIVGVSIGDPANKATWKVRPPSLQAAAQPTIDAFNPADPAHALAVADAQAAIEYRRMNRLAMFAVMAEAYNPAWATMTNAQRRAEVVRLAKRWEQQRNWVTRNYEFMAF